MASSSVHRGEALKRAGIAVLVEAASSIRVIRPIL